MLTLRKVAVTGSLSCGKSLVCRLFRELGAYVVDADEVVHKLLNPTTDLGREVINLLGPDIVVDGTFDRSRIANKVFNNAQLLHALEKLLHPAVRLEIDRQYRQIAKQQTYSLFIAEIPLFFEIGETGYDYTIAVVASEELCKKRFLASRQQSEAEFYKRMARQMSPEKKAARADFVLNNNGTTEDLRVAVKALSDQLTK